MIYCRFENCVRSKHVLSRNETAVCFLHCRHLPFCLKLACKHFYDTTSFCLARLKINFVVHIRNCLRTSFLQIPHRKEYLSSLKADVLKQAKGFYQEHERFIKTFDPKWRSDENVVLILCAITLFTPDRPKVIHHDVIKLEQVGVLFYFFCCYQLLEFLINLHFVVMGGPSIGTFLNFVVWQHQTSYRPEILTVY